MVAICTRYNSLPMEYNIDCPESEMTCGYSNSRVPGGFAAYNINPSEALAKWLQGLPVTHLHLTMVSGQRLMARSEPQIQEADPHIAKLKSESHDGG